MSWPWSPSKRPKVWRLRTSAARRPLAARTREGNVIRGRQSDAVGGDRLLIVGDDRTEQLPRLPAASALHDVCCFCWLFGVFVLGSALMLEFRSLTPVTPVISGAVVALFGVSS